MQISACYSHDSEEKFPPLPPGLTGGRRGLGPGRGPGRGRGGRITKNQKKLVGS